MAAYLDRVRKLSALLFLIAVAIVLVPVAVPSDLPIERGPVLALLLVAALTGVAIYQFPWERFHPNLFLAVGTTACAMLALLIAWTGGRGSVFFPIFVFVVVASGAYYTAVPLAFVTVLTSLASLTYTLYQPFTREDLLRSGVEIAIYAGCAFVCNTIFRGLQRSHEGAQRILAEASALLTSSLDYEATLQSVARLAVPSLGSCCVVDLAERGLVRTVAVATDEPTGEEPLRELLAACPPARLPGAHVSRTGLPALLPRLDDAALRRAFPEPEQATLLRRMGVTSVMAVPLQARGRTLGAITFATTSRRRYRAGDLALAQDLARRAALAVDNARLHRDLQQALTTRDEFLSHAAHDLKNPLTTARAQSQLLRSWTSRDERPAADRLGQGFDRLDTAITKMARLIDELRDVANLEVGRPLQLRQEAVDLVAVARASVAEYGLASRRHQIRLETHLDQLVGEWDGGRLDRVLANLLDNAIKYTPQGGEIVVAVDRVEAEGGAEAALSVRDPGIGVPAQDLPHIFNRYHRAANVVRRIVGSGIGLAGVRAIVEQHGGRVDVESQEGVGSRFTVRLPLVSAGVPAELR